MAIQQDKLTFQQKAENFKKTVIDPALKKGGNNGDKKEKARSKKA